MVCAGRSSEKRHNVSDGLQQVRREQRHQSQLRSHPLHPGASCCWWGVRYRQVFDAVAATRSVYFSWKAARNTSIASIRRRTPMWLAIFNAVG